MKAGQNNHVEAYLIGRLLVQMAIQELIPKCFRFKEFVNEEKGFKLCVQIVHEACMDSAGKCQ